MKTPPTPPARILVVDDSVLLLDLAREAFGAAGWQVSTARDLAELATFEGQSFELILMDVQMPEAFGDDVASLLRHVRGVDTPIYLLSSVDEAELARRTIDAEIDGYVSKRGGIDAVVATVRLILEQEA